MELREYLKFELKKVYKVLEAPNGKNGLEIARKNKPDIIIADVMMPENGWLPNDKVIESLKNPQ